MLQDDSSSPMIFEYNYKTHIVLSREWLDMISDPLVLAVYALVRHDLTPEQIIEKLSLSDQQFMDSMNWLGERGLFNGNNR